MSQVVTPNKLPKKWADVGAKRGFEATPPDRLRQLILGAPGHGKTTWIASIPNTLILDFESGAQNVMNQRAHRVTVETADQYREIINLLVDEANNGKQTFNAVAFDTTGGWVDMLCQEFLSEPGKENIESIREFGTRGAGYGLIGDRAVNDLNTLYYNKYVWIVVDHLTETKHSRSDGTSFTTRRPAMFPSLAKRLWRLADLIGTIEREVKLVPTKIKKKIKGKTVEVPGKDKREVRHILGLADKGTVEDSVGDKARLPNLPEDIEVPKVNAWDHFVDVYEEAAKKTEAEIRQLNEKENG